MKFFKLLPFLSLLLFNQLYAQSTYYTSLYDNTTFTKTIDLSKPVGSTDGSASVSSSGGATYTIPIKCPPGTAGMVPNLSVVYNSQGENGILGQGWNLSGLSAISRAGKNMYHDGKVGPVLYSNQDAFMLDGTRLVVKTGTNGGDGATYRTEAESYSVIASYETVGGGPKYFNVVSKDGTIMQYGNSADSRFLSDDETKVMMWRLNKIQDINGNYISFTYNNSDRESRISQIKYTGNVNTSLAPYAEIRFQYEIRSDKNTLFDAGYTIKSKYVLEDIILSVDGKDFKNYSFQYGFADGVSFLKRVQEFAINDGTSSSSEPPLNDTRFKYGNEVNGVSYTQSNINVDYNETATAVNYDIFSGDYDGDGKTEVLRARYDFLGAVYINDRNYLDFSVYKQSSSPGTYSVMTGSNVTLPGVNNYLISYQRNNSRNGYNFVHSDFNGDGKDDILFMNITSDNLFNGVSIYYSNLGTTSPGFTKTDIPPASLSGTHQMFGQNIMLTGDFDGDKKSDYLYMTAHDDPATGHRYLHTFVSFPGKAELNIPIMQEGDPSKYDETATACLRNVSTSGVKSMVNILDLDGDGISE